MKVFGENRRFDTERRFLFRGKEGEEGYGVLKVRIETEEIATDEMTAKLEKLATETMEKAKKIVAAQEAPQQRFF